jgi:hypothetical protein
MPKRKPTIKEMRLWWEYCEESLLDSHEHSDLGYHFRRFVNCESCKLCHEREGFIHKTKLPPNGSPFYHLLSGLDSKKTITTNCGKCRK